MALSNTVRKKDAKKSKEQLYSGKRGKGRGKKIRCCSNWFEEANRRWDVISSKDSSETIRGEEGLKFWKSLHRL